VLGLEGCQPHPLPVAKRRRPTQISTRPGFLIELGREEAKNLLEVSFRISPSHEYSGLVSFRIDWFYLLAVQGTRKIN